jgi:hypothetical protein
MECCQKLRLVVRSPAVEKSDHRHRRLLRARDERPRRRGAEERDEVAAIHCRRPPVLATQTNSTPRYAEDCCAVGFRIVLNPRARSRAGKPASGLVPHATAAPPGSAMNSRRFNRLIRMYPDRFEDPTAPYPKGRIAVRGSVTYFAVHRETHGMAAYVQAGA